MRNTILLCFVCGFFLIVNNVMAVDLDAPVEKKITVKSEIERGHSAVFDCRLHLLPGSIIGIQDCVFNAIDSNKQKNTDTDAFILGAYFEGWSDAAIYVSVLSENGRAKDSDMQGTGFLYKQFKKSQEKLGIDDAALCDAVHLKYEMIKPRLDEWAKIVKGK